MYWLPLVLACPKLHAPWHRGSVYRASGLCSWVRQRVGVGFSLRLGLCFDSKRVAPTRVLEVLELVSPSVLIKALGPWSLTEGSKVSASASAQRFHC